MLGSYVIPSHKYLDKNKYYSEVSGGAGSKESRERGYGLFTFLKTVNCIYVRLLRFYGSHCELILELTVESLEGSLVELMDASTLLRDQ